MKNDALSITRQYELLEGMLFPLSFLFFYLGEPFRQRFSENIDYFIRLRSGCPFPIFVVAFAPQRHNKGFALPSFSQNFAKNALPLQKESLRNFSTKFQPSISQNEFEKVEG